jgi:hypothetical protein
MTTASSSVEITVDFGSFGPVGWSAIDPRFFLLGDGLGIDAAALGKCSQARLTILYCSTDRLNRFGASVQHLSRSASFHSREKIAPSKPGIKQQIFLTSVSF